MFTFATLFGIAVLNSRNLTVMPDNYNALFPFFDIPYPLVNLSVFKEQNPWSIGNWLRWDDEFLPPNTNIIKGNKYPTSYTFFHHVREHIQNLFQFKPVFRQHAVDTLRRMMEIKPWTEVFVGVHVRRGDYLKRSKGGWLRGFDGREVDMEYFQRSVDYFKTKYNNVTFVAVSDDRKWCIENLSKLGILTMEDSQGPGYDLALLSECNHTIMTYGTYGFWAGYLAGGDTVYFSDFLKPNTSMTTNYFLYDKMYLPEWIGISTTKPGFWESYTNPFNVK